MNTKRPVNQAQRDSRETDLDTSLKGFSSSLAKNIGQSFGDLGSGIFDQLSGSMPTLEGDFGREQSSQTPIPESKSRPEFNRTIFNFREIEERKQIGEIKELVNAVKEEVKAIKKAGEGLTDQVNDIDNILINERGEKSNIYTIKFLELVLSLLRTIRMKVGESRTWMDALVSKKAKRGSLFASRTKKQGTQYSQSEEMKLTRSTQ